MCIVETRVDSFKSPSDGERRDLHGPLNPDPGLVTNDMETREMEDTHRGRMETQTAMSGAAEPGYGASGHISHQSSSDCCLDRQLPRPFKNANMITSLSCQRASGHT